MTDSPAMSTFLNACRNWADGTTLICLIAGITAIAILCTTTDRKTKRSYIKAIGIVAVILWAAWGWWTLNHFS